MRIIAVHPLDLLGLPRRQRFMRIKALYAFKQTLSSKTFVDAGNAAGKGMRRTKEGRIRFRYFNTSAIPYR
jgi:hypothetical protein